MKVVSSSHAEHLGHIEVQKTNDLLDPKPVHYFAMTGFSPLMSSFLDSSVSSIENSGSAYPVLFIHPLPRFKDMDTMDALTFLAVQSVLIEHGCTATCLRGIKDGENRKIMDRLMAEAVQSQQTRNKTFSHGK